MSKAREVWYNRGTGVWYVQVAADHERALIKADWWEGTEIVVSQGYDYSKRYGWFQYIAVPAKHYLKHHPEEVYTINAIIENTKLKKWRGLND
jgi:hypothetical protein